MTHKKQYALNATSASLLGFLHERPMTGWDIHVVASERIGKFWSITKSQVYRELISLAGAGYITVGEKGSRMKQPYVITDDGKKAFAEWINAIDDTETIRIPMLLAVSFSRFMDPVVLERILQDNLSSHTKKLHEYQSLLRSLPNTTVAADGRRTLSFGIRYETMLIEWIQETLKSYRAGKSD
jgi:DNA-binding PadR family transcriptional regulator